MSAHRKTEELEQEFEIVGQRLKEIVAEMYRVEPASRQRDPEAWKTIDIVRGFCSDLLIVKFDKDNCGCLLCGG